ncbi:secreted RxLR effector protein 161-like [Coffea arabica]|uniref:Secreted RxLR effector protein 161-like n=1 Tax=Coffea arabica TaxID=13443 RepID=A0ABM4U5T2_COFAR
MDRILYASLVGSHMYAQVCTRPNIAFTVGMLGMYQNNPAKDHGKATKRVLRYLQGTKDYRLIYKQSDYLEVVGYSNSDFAGCVDSSKSTSEYIFLLTGEAVSWRSIKQTIVASSTTEAEFIACYETTSQGLWLKNFISGLQVVDLINRPLKIFNSAAVFFTKNNKSGSRNKHIDIKFLMVRDHVKKQEVIIGHINTKLMIVDPMTKGLSAKVFQDHAIHMGFNSSCYIISIFLIICV